MERLRKITKNIREPGWELNSLSRKTLSIIRPAQLSIQQYKANFFAGV
jgi:hypothetical protein